MGDAHWWHSRIRVRIPAYCQKFYIKYIKSGTEYGTLGTTRVIFLYIKPSLGRNVQNVSKLTFVICIVRCKCVLEKSISISFTTKTDHNDMHILIILYMYNGKVVLPINMESNCIDIQQQEPPPLFCH